MDWPRDTREELDDFYGRHVLGADGRPTAAWQRENLKLIVLPFPFTLSWDLAIEIRKLTCHKKVAESLTGILEQILAHYGSIQEIKRARMHLYGGNYNFRRISGSNRLSTHAWGAGIDIDPQKNPLGKPYDETAGMMPKAVVRIFEAEGWKWGGRFRSRPDCMHFQATS
ncbi:MAG TPA: M15 family metallopeptidase [Blastocatellia bacterium]|nr:M15 family metallopeptidase [Blastocatellia bacterium]